MESAVTSVRPRIIYVVTEDWYFWSHRLDLARAARDAGFDVVIATKVTKHGERISKEGFQLVPLGVIRRSRNPLQEWATVSELARLYRSMRPDVVHHVALKPVLYGSLAAWLSGVPVVVNAFAGLGYLFTEERTTVLRWVVKIALKAMVKLSRSFVLAQNLDDQQQLVNEGIVPVCRTKVIAGSGVDTHTFSTHPPPAGVPIVLLPARMLWDKGVAEFVEAARHLKNKGLLARFVLAGRCDEHNPAAIAESFLTAWINEGVVEWWGHQEEMPAVYQAASLVVLPSYREGLPKALLEAAACGKAIVATDVPGCRDIVRHQKNGLLVPARNWNALAHAILSLLANPDQQAAMGRAGREMVVREYSIVRIAGETLALYRELLNAYGQRAQPQALA